MNPDNDVVFELLAHNELRKFQEFIKKSIEYYVFAEDASIFDWQHKGPQAYHCMVAKKITASA